MIVNEIYYGQGLGNQLWNYALTRIIADKNNYDFSITGTHKFKGKSFLKLDFGKECTGGDSPEGGPPTALPNGITNYYREKKESHFQNGTDVSRYDEQIFNLSDNSKFDGNCQSTTYFTGMREKILKWIEISKEYKDNYITDENMCIIHVRCGDYCGQSNVFLPTSYFINAMNHIRTINPEVKFYWVTDQPDVVYNLFGNVNIISSSISARDKYAADHHFGGDIGVDFAYMSNAKYLIIPNSSFSWWAAYLNQNNPIVIAPEYWAHYNISNGYWSTFDIITDEFLYLSRDGNLKNATQCKSERKNFENQNQHIFIKQ